MLTHRHAQEWTGCYADAWKGIITNASFAHPAKFSKALIERILDYMASQGWLKKGDMIGDPFGGVGTGGIVAAYRGYRWIGVELEHKFVALAMDNFMKHAGKIHALRGCPPVMLLGDSRQFDARVDAFLSSPPSISGGHHNDVFDSWNTGRGGQQIERHKAGYGKSSGQIAALKSGKVDAVVGSPPFTGALSGRGIITEGHNDASRPSSKTIGARTFQGKGGDRDPENIEVLEPGKVDAVLASPPYETISAGAGGLNHLPARGKQQGGRKKGASQSADQTYGRTPGQIAHTKKAPLGAILTSPAYQDSVNSESHGIDFSKSKRDYPGRANSPSRNKAHSDAAKNMRYGDTPGQIGSTTGETYWQAMAKVYHACFLSLKAGGVMAIVVKDFIKDKQRMPLCDDTMRLLVWLGFEEIERIHAMLTEEQIHNDLFEGTRRKVKERKSFFRRLHESNLAPDDPRRIDFEEVLIVRKPI